MRRRRIGWILQTWDTNESSSNNFHVHDENTIHFHERNKEKSNFIFIHTPSPSPPSTSHKTSTTKKSHQFTSLSSQLRRNRRSSNHRLIPRALLLRPRQSHIILQRKFRLGIPLSRFKFHNQRIFDGKYRIIFQVFGFGIENLRCDGFVTFVLHNVVDVCGAERVAVHEFEEFTGGAVVGDLGRGCVSVFILIFYFYFLNLFLILSYFFYFSFLFFYFISFLFLLFLCNFLLHRHKQRDENLLDMELVGGSKRRIYPLQWYRTFHGGCDRLAHHLVVRKVL